jgi:hypothetical protein
MIDGTGIFSGRREHQKKAIVLLRATTRSNAAFLKGILEACGNRCSGRLRQSPDTAVGEPMGTHELSQLCINAVCSGRA